MQLSRLLFVGDAHVPFHDVRAWSLMLKAGRALKPDTLVCVGDQCDFYSISSHSKDPQRALELEDELNAVRKSLDQLDALGARRKHFVAGNHCDRLQRYLRDRCPELFRTLSVPDLLGLQKRGWTYTAYKDTLKLGDLHVTHDVGNSGKNATHAALDVFQSSCVTGHSHRLSYVAEGNGQGQAVVSASFGWLGDVQKVDYMSKAKAGRTWSLGFGIGYLDEQTGHVHLQPVPILDYTCVVEGKVYRG